MLSNSAKRLLKGYDIFMLNKETKSIINFLDKDEHCFEDYINKCIADDNLDCLSYSDLLITMKLYGTTKEGVNFRSSKVSRKKVSEYMDRRFKEERLLSGIIQD